MKSFIELLEVAEGKASGAILAAVTEYISDVEVAGIPGCLYKRIGLDGKEIPAGEVVEADQMRVVPNMPVLCALAYGRALHDDPDITYDEVRVKIPVTDREKVRGIMKELYYFYTDLTRDQVELIFPEPVDEVEPASEEVAEPQPDLPAGDIPEDQGITDEVPG